MKKVLHKTTFISLCFVLGLLLTGCSETNAKENNDTGSTMVTTEASGEIDVSDTTELSAANELPNEISDEDVLNQISSDTIQDITINSHNSESLTQCDYGTQYITRDTVNVTYNAGNITGLLPQTVSKDYEFYLNKDTSEWEMLSDTITACEVDNSALPNSSWKCESIDSTSAKLLFGDEIESDEKGTLYFHFLNLSSTFFVGACTILHLLKTRLRHASINPPLINLDQDSLTDANRFSGCRWYVATHGTFILLANLVVAI